MPAPLGVGKTMPDFYGSVDEVLAHERRHVTILERHRGRSTVAVLAPHAGAIEPLTGELAQAIAGREHRLYCFIGNLPSQNNRLHITSTRFDEPGLRQVLQHARVAVSLHGAAGDDEAVTLVGGANRRLAYRVGEALEAAGFTVIEASGPLAGADPRNLVNRVPEGGVQLELTRKLRWELTRGFIRRPLFERYVAAVRSALPAT